MLGALVVALVALGAPVTGTVRDADTGAPLAGVAVHAPGEPAAAARSDSLGRFTVRLRAPARLRFTGAGYAAAEVAAAPGDSLAVSLTAAPQALEAVTVTALRGDAAAPVSQSRRSQRDLEAAYAGQEMPVLLARLPSITATSDAGSEAGYTYFRLRGLDQSRVNVTLDGVPLNEPEDQGVYFSNFPDFANSLRSVQVQRGVGTSSYGTASYAGAINFESVALAAARRGGELQVTAGSYGLRRASAEYQTGLGANGVAAYARLSAQETDGYRRHSGNESGSAFASAGWFGARQVWKATAFTGLARNDMAYVAAPLDSLRADRRYNPLGRDERDRFRQHFASLSHTASLGQYATLATTAYHVRLRGDYDVRVAPDLLNFNLGSAWTGLLSTAHLTRGALTVDAGAHASSYRREHWLVTRSAVGGRLYTNAGRKEEASAFAKGALDVGRATVLADVQLRGARFRYEPDANSGVGERSLGWTFVNPKAGVTVRAAPRLALYASLGRTGREPTRNDMLAGFDNLDSSNVAFVGPFDRVRPEYVTDAETGATLDTRAGTLRVNGFWMAFRDEIAPIGQLSYIGLPLRKNVDRSTRRGIEMDATLRPGRRLEGSVSAAVTHSRIARYTDDATGVTYRDVEPLLTPHVTAAHDLRYALAGPVSLYLGGRFASRAFLANTGDARYVLPAAYLADAGVRVGGERHAVQLVVHNVADARAYSGGYTDGATSYYYVHAARHLTLTARGGF